MAEWQLVNASARGVRNFGRRDGLNANTLENKGRKVETEKNQELALLIGRRLREACARDFDKELPTAIAGGLAALRDIEIRTASVGCAGASGCKPIELKSIKSHRSSDGESPIAGDT